MSKFQKRHVNQIWWNVITWYIKSVISTFSKTTIIKLGWNAYSNKQHDLTPRIYFLHKITIALKFISYIN